MTLLWLPIGLWALAIAAWDFRYRRIPNWLSLPALGVACLAAVFLEPCALLWGAAWAIVYAIAFYRGGMGAGDVKLAGSLGIAVGGGGALPVVVAILVANTLSVVWALTARRQSVAHGPWMLVGTAVAAWIFPGALLWA